MRSSRPYGHQQLHLHRRMRQRLVQGRERAPRCPRPSTPTPGPTRVPAGQPCPLRPAQTRRSCSGRAPRGCRPRRSRPAPGGPPRSARRGAGEAASATCTTSSASVTSSRVERNASTRSCGSLPTNPTVSVTVQRRPPGSFSRRTVGSRVANSWSATRTSAPVRRVQQGGLAGVRVAGDRGLRDAAVLATRALGLAGLRHRADVAAELGDPPLQVLAVDLQLRLAAADPGADAAAGAAHAPRPSPGAAGSR